MIEYINVATVRSNNPDADCHPGFLKNTGSDFNSKGMMNDGVRPISVTMFIVKNYGVIYRLRGLELCVL